VRTKEAPWCKKAVARGYLTSKELRVLKRQGHIRWVQVIWGSPPGRTWERVIVPTDEDRFKYIRSDYNRPEDPETINVVMFETDYTLQSTRQLVVKAQLGAYEPARIYEVDVLKAYEEVREPYLREIGEDI
jgi:hypothetical protein